MEININLETVDWSIIIGFFSLILIAGMIMNKFASKGISNYFLGGKKIPWWVLGASGTASNVDISGTAIIVAYIYTLGLNGFWVEMRGGTALPLAFLMVFLGKWYRRTRVMTEAEFMKFRFGEGTDGKLARTFSAIANLVVTLGMVIYFAKGTGMFVGQFVHFVPDPVLNEYIASGIMMIICLAYTVSSGLYGVVFTDVIQEIMIIITAIFVSVKAFFLVGSMSIPERFTTFNLPFTQEIPGHPEYHMFTYVVLFFILKGVMEGMGGLGGYMSQRYYAARNEKEAGLLTAEWIILLSFRWTFIMALAILGLSVSAQVQQVGAERVLPIVISEMLPAGIKGIAIAGMIAAAMSTFDSTINAGASYFVKDIFQARINPDADETLLVRMSRLSSVVIALIGFVLSMVVPSIDYIWNFINASLLAGMFLPLVLRWFWERLNGYGFAIGTGAGIVASLVMQIMQVVQTAQLGEKVVYPPYISFPIPLLFSLLGCVIATYLTPETPEEIRINFLRRPRVGGFWTETKRKMGFDFVRDITI
jgi:solute:Na+ symporter, SSS family